jgi:hypothetical protein
MNSLALFEEKHVRRAWNAAEEKWYFCIVDVIAILTASNNPQVYWRVMKKRLSDEGNETVTKCNTLKMPAAQAGGTIAGNARKELETQSGTRISTQENFKALTESATKALPRRKPKAD